ncbi:hypothetical protein C5167_007504 [Papaver somniferum]|nr:hypothetical protein C5167_007504 [Papaver somniferum]
MMMPRCGRADVVDAEPGKRKNNQDELAASTPEKWSSSHLTYRFSSNSKISDKVDTQTLKYAVSQAFAKWEAVSNFKFTEATNEDVGADMVIGFQKGDLGDGTRLDYKQM